MSLTDKEKAVLAKAGLSPAAVKLADAEARRMRRLALLRLDAYWPIRPLLAMLIAGGLFFASEQWGHNTLVALVTVGCALFLGSLWVITRKDITGLLDKAPERWAARHLVYLAVNALSKGPQLGLVAARFEQGISPEAALRSLADDERERRGSIRWYHDAIIIAVILIPLAMVISVPILLQRP